MGFVGSRVSHVSHVSHQPFIRSNHVFSCQLGHDFCWSQCPNRLKTHFLRHARWMELMGAMLTGISHARRSKADSLDKLVFEAKMSVSHRFLLKSGNSS